MTRSRPEWDPEQYDRFARPRLRPALELLDRVHHDDPRLIHDLGTGSGNIARLMADRWPAAAVTGSDASPEMLARAASDGGRVSWELLDIADWRPTEPIDVIYANSVLHWLPRHDELFRRLFRFLAPCGVLAVQMPLSWGEPSHTIMREVLSTGAGRGSPMGSASLRDRLDRQPVQEPGWYFELLEALGATVDVWVTRYFQVLEGQDAVFEWVRGAALRPVLDDLSPEDLDLFIDTYRARLLDAYPPLPKGGTLYPFPRLFVVARAPVS